MGIRKSKRVVTGIIAAALLVSLGVLGGWIIADKREYNASNAYPLLDPSVSEPSIHQEIINFDPLRQNIKQYLGSLNFQHSLYFEYLSNGISIRNGDDQASVAASLMKTPVVMDMYKVAEEGKLNLDTPVTVQQKDISTDTGYGNYLNLQAGNTITLRKAAQTTLHQSDNTTVNVIKDQVVPVLTGDSDSIQSLDISYSYTGNTPNTELLTISARSYSSILKCLYFACFDNPKDSEAMLNNLTGSAEHNRLMAGVGQGIKVAHKVGSSPTSQSDCGIVYYPGKPYLVCLMFWGIPSNTNPDPYFQHVSQMIYDYIQKSGNTNG